MYSQLLETFIKDSQEKDRLFNAIETIPCISNKAKWCLDWIQRYQSNFLFLLLGFIWSKKHLSNQYIIPFVCCSPMSFAVRLVAFACVEGIFFSGRYLCSSL